MRAVEDELGAGPLDILHQTPEEEGELGEEGGEAIGAGEAERAAVALVLVEVGPGVAEAAGEVRLVDQEDGDSCQDEDIANHSAVLDDHAGGEKDQRQQHVVFPVGEIDVVDPERKGRVRDGDAEPEREIEVKAEEEPGDIEAAGGRAAALDESADQDAEDEYRDDVAAERVVEEVIAQGAVGQDGDEDVEAEVRTAEGDEAGDDAEKVRDKGNEVA